MSSYVVLSDRLSRKEGETFTDEELPASTIETLIAGGHLAAIDETENGQVATNKEGK